MADRIAELQDPVGAFVEKAKGRATKYLDLD